MSNTAKAFKILLERKKISIGAVAQAVADGVLTEEEYKEITGDDYGVSDN